MNWRRGDFVLLVFVSFVAIGVVHFGLEVMLSVPPSLMAAENEVRDALRGKSMGSSKGSKSPRGEKDAWGRNPFLTPEEEAKGGRTGTRGPTIQAIITGRERAVATLDGRMVSVGDPIGDEVVVEIRRDAVVLERNGRRRILRVQELSRITNGVRVIEK